MEQLTPDGGVTKRIIKAGLGQRPEPTNFVSGKREVWRPMRMAYWGFWIVHYDAYLLDTSEKFDSSRDRNTEFTFQLRDCNQPPKEKKIESSDWFYFL